MGQFDKQDAAGTGGQRNKIILAVGLAAALAVVAGLQFSKSTPRAAVANSGAGPSDTANAAAPPAQRTVSQELEALQNDPTAPLLHGTPQDATFLAPPRDPFRMDLSWRQNLTKVTPATPVAPQTVNSAAPRPAVVTPQGAILDGIKLQGIFLEHQKLAALINGNIVHAGMIVGTVRVCDILDDRIIVQNPSFPSGPRTEVMLKASINK